MLVKQQISLIGNVKIAGNISEHLSSLLGSKISVMDILDQFMLIEMGCAGDNKILNQYVRKSLNTIGIETPMLDF